LEERGNISSSFSVGKQHYTSLCPNINEKETPSDGLLAALLLQRFRMSGIEHFRRPVSDIIPALTNNFGCRKPQTVQLIRLRARRTEIIFADGEVLMPAASVRQEEVKNFILSSLPADEFAHLASSIEFVSFASGERLYGQEEAVRYIHFINDGLLSLLSILEDGTSIEVGALGREGIGGISVLLGSDTAAHMGMAQADGAAYRIRTEHAREAFRTLPMFQQKILRYTRMLMSQISMIAACNTLHTVEERLARWLLMCRQRVESDDIPLTQEFLSHMLGVRRSGVTVAIGILERAGLISHRRGTIHITDAERLKEASCECVRAMSDEFNSFVNE
jgi:CRP-like cAMP-binding protein